MTAERRDTEISRSSSSVARSSFWSRDRGASRHGYVPFDLYLVPNLQIGYGSLLNPRLRHLKLSLIEWFVILASLACVPAALRVAGATGDVENRSVFLALLCYVGLGAAARALIPTYGQSVAVAYWGMSILAVVYLGFAWRARRGH